MPNVFISHSSSDKLFVKSLAVALLSDGFPVWLDSWNIEYGNSLLDTIYEAIDTTSFLLLIMSKSSTESGWVNRELNAGLAKEEQLGRKFVIPVKIDSCNLPLKVADRFYADFTSSFTSSLGKLSEFLANKRCRELSVPQNRELLALEFDRGVHLNRVALERAIRYITRRQGRYAFSGSQVVVGTDASYDTLLQRLHKRVDSLETDPHFSADFADSLRSSLEDVRNSEHQLREGVALLVTNLPRDAEAAYWFSRIVRARIVALLWHCQTPGASDILEYGKEWLNANLASNFGAARLFEVTSVVGMKLGAPSGKGWPDFPVWVDPRDLMGPLLYSGHDLPLGHFPVSEVCKWRARSKFIYPQIVMRHIREGTGPVPWELENATIGVA